MMYKDFVKQEFHKLPKTMPAKEKLKEIGAMWRKKHGGEKAKPKAKGGVITGAGVKPRGRKSAKGGVITGAGLLGSLIPLGSLLGL